MTKPIFSGEVQLAGWTDSHNSGAKVTFWLSDPSDLDAFRGMTERKGKTSGQRLAMVLVEIGDDEQPVQQPKPIGPLCKLAVQWCTNKDFQRWAGVNTEQDAKQFMLRKCGVNSRRDFDDIYKGGPAFNEMIREPFMQWLGPNSLSAKYMATSDDYRYLVD